MEEYKEILIFVGMVFLVILIGVIILRSTKSIEIGHELVDEPQPIETEISTSSLEGSVLPPLQGLPPQGGGASVTPLE